MTSEQVQRAANRATVEKLFARDWDATVWAELWADDAVQEIPFAVLGLPTVLKGRSEIASRMKHLAANVFVDAAFTDARIYPALDPNLFFVEVEFDATIKGSEKHYHQEYIMRVHVQDGKVTHLREYLNPLLALEGYEGQEERTYQSPTSTGPGK